MSCHVIQDESESCGACEARARGEKTINLNGPEDVPLCRGHFNRALENVHPYGE